MKYFGTNLIYKNLHDSDWIKQASIAISLHLSKPISLSEEQEKDIMNKLSCVGLKYITQDDYGFESYYHKFDKKNFTISLFKDKIRNQIRQGLKNYQLVIVNYSEFIDQCFNVNISTLKRQKRNDSLSNYENWTEFAKKIYDNKDFKIFGVRNNETHKIDAFAITVDFGDFVEIIKQSSSTDSLSLRSNNALVFMIMNELMNNTSQYKYIGYGVGSLEDVLSLDKFKESMGFNRVSVLQKIVLKTPLNLAFSLIPVDPIIHFVTLIGTTNYSVVKFLYLIKRYREQKFHENLFSSS